jgi:cytoskeletal protein CcmA (bactofilin family)
MSALFKRWPPSGDLSREAAETTISAGTTVGGPVRTSDSIRVDGRIEGAVHAEATVIVGPDGVISGDVTAANVHVAGAVHGRVRATYRLEIADGGELHGDVDVARLAIQDGALFRGQVLMRDSDEEPEPPAD